MSSCCLKPKPPVFFSTRRIRVALFPLQAVTLRADRDFQLLEEGGAYLSYLHAGENFALKTRGKKLFFEDLVSEKGFSFSSGPHSNVWHIDGLPYAGNLRVTRFEKAFWLILDVSLEEYVAGVVALESAPGFSLESLKAQAVASRSYACFRKEQEPRRSDLFDVYASSRDQVFKGSTISSRVRRAVSATWGQVLIFNRKILPAFFHATCGGHSISSQDYALSDQELPPLKGVSCDFCRESPVYRWRLSLPLKKIIALFFPEVRKIISLRLECSSQGHVFSLIFKTDRGKKKIKASTFRRKWGSARIRSERFKARIQEGFLHIEGKGWGHGVGLCQWGAEGMARQGASYKEILKHYYPLSHLEKR
jgi:stage II sporulation protein D